jgi:hypothetical protein
VDRTDRGSSTGRLKQALRRIAVVSQGQRRRVGANRVSSSPLCSWKRRSSVADSSARGSDGFGRRRSPEEGEAVAKLCDGQAGIVVSMLTMVCSSLSQISGRARRQAVQLDI